MLKLYYSVGSCALASHIALEEAGADYQAVRISLRDGDQLKPGFLAINPRGRVPALVTAQGVLTENVAILAYVAQSHPEARLAPADPFGFARAQAFNAYMSSTVHVAYAHRRRGYRWADDKACLAHLHDQAPERFAGTIQAIEDHMLQGPYVLGADFSICDAYLFTLSGWLEEIGVDRARFPRVLEHRERVRDRSAVGKVLAEQAV
jgi:glutathione S-transferase